MVTIQERCYTELREDGAREYFRWTSERGWFKTYAPNGIGRGSLNAFFRRKQTLERPSIRPLDVSAEMLPRMPKGLPNVKHAGESDGSESKP